MDTAPSATAVDLNSHEDNDFIKSLQTPEKPHRFVTRKAWRAAKPRRKRRIKHPVRNVILNYHWGEVKCLDRESCQDLLQDEQRRLMRECGEDDIPFHFLIGDDGTVYEGRGWHFVSSKKLDYPKFETYGYNRIDVAYIGNYEYGEDDELIKPVYDLIMHGVVMKYVEREWALEEEPVPTEGLPLRPPKNQGPPPPRLWW